MKFVLNDLSKLRLLCIRISRQPHIEYMTASVHNEIFFFLETSSGNVCDDSYKYVCDCCIELLVACIVLEKPPVITYIDCMNN
jgi:hypothetical protein